MQICLELEATFNILPFFDRPLKWFSIAPLRHQGSYWERQHFFRKLFLPQSVLDVHLERVNAGYEIPAIRLRA